MATTTSAQRVWEAALGRLQVQLTRPTFDTWLRDTRGLSLDGESLCIGVPTTFAAEWLEQRMSGLVEAAVTAAARQPLSVTFRVHNHSANAGIPTISPGSVPLTSWEDPRVNNSATNLNPRYTFDSFVVSPASQLAHAASLAASDRPGSAYNPLFIHAGVGLGKTHLLQAIAHRVQAQGKDARYVSSEEFTNDFISAIRERKTVEFRNKLRSVDVLLIDDIQFLSGKEQTQEGFFHTFNALHNASRQVIIAGDRPPSALPLLEERLRSRFEGGLITDIQAPDFETRIAILRNRIQQAPVPVPDVVLELIAASGGSNIRTLEGNLNRVTALAHFTGHQVTMAMAQSILGSSGEQPLPTPKLTTTPLEALEIIAAHYQVDSSRLLGRHRDKGTSSARQIAMLLLAQEFHLSPEEVGTILGGRDRTTVIYAQRKVNSLSALHPQVQADIAQLRRILRQPPT